MATKNRIAYALPIIQIIQILSDKFHKQMCLRLIYRERVGIVPFGLDVPKKPSINWVTIRIPLFNRAPNGR